MANLEMENELADKQLGLAAKRAAVATQTASIDAKALKSAIQGTGLTAEQLAAWKNAKSYGEQAAAMGSKAVPTIDAGQSSPAEVSRRPRTLHPSAFGRFFAFLGYGLKLLTK